MNGVAGMERNDGAVATKSARACNLGTSDRVCARCVCVCLCLFEECVIFLLCFNTRYSPMRGWGRWQGFVFACERVSECLWCAREAFGLVVYFSRVIVDLFKLYTTGERIFGQSVCVVFGGCARIIFYVVCVCMHAAGLRRWVCTHKY